MSNDTLLDQLDQATIDGTSIEDFDKLLAQRSVQIQAERALETPEQRVQRRAEWKAYLANHTNTK